ncbi:hypothetical protein [Citrobacter youngae]|nr:hypothetical protein [Citrobacter youngae]
MNSRHVYWLLTLLSKMLFISCFSAITYADDQPLSLNVHANIINNSCKVTVSGSGSLDLGKESKAGIEAANSVTDYIGGGKTFSITVSECSSFTGGSLSKLHFGFSPQTGEFPTQTSQVFINESSPQAGGASGVGLVIFSEQQMANVLDTSGHSDVAFEVTPDSYLSSFCFFCALTKN